MMATTLVTGRVVSSPADGSTSVHRGDVLAAARRIAGYVRRTPVVDVTIDGHRIWLKLENLQVTGSFKARGATNAVMLHCKPGGSVVAASGGNHGAGVAYAAQAVGCAATIVVPMTTPEMKQHVLRNYGAHVVLHGEHFAQSATYARTLAEEMEAPMIHPYADPEVIAGQGTVALEVAQDVGKECDAIVMAVGGGGLIGGVGTALEGRFPVIGVEPVGIPTLHNALSAGRPVDVAVNSVTASALGAERTADLNLQLAQRYASEVILVTDDEILAARGTLWESCRQAVEPGGAVALAAVLHGRVRAQRPCVIVCGANAQWVPID